MGFLDRLLGREPQQQYPASIQPAPPPAATSPGVGPAADDERAVARYRYLLRTAPPEELERVHAHAFARLTPEQRGQVLAELSRDLPPGERATGDDPQSLARTATRAELRQPGYLEQTFSRGRFGGGMGMGGTIMGSMMGTIAGVVIGSAVAGALFDGYDSSPEAAEAGDAGAADGGDQAGDAGSGDAQQASADGGDYGGNDVGGGDYGGGDFGGGDFGGGDF